MTVKAFARAAALATLAVAALAGCVRFTSETSIKADDTFTQVAVIAATDEALEQLGALGPMDLANLKGTLKSSEGYLALVAAYPGQIDVEDFAEDDLRGITITMTDLPLEEFEQSFAQLTAQLPFTANATIARTEETYVVSLPAGSAPDGLAAAGVSAGQLELLGTAVDVRVTFSFPGLVTSATAGEIDGKSVTLGISDLLSGDDITIVAGAQDQMDWEPWLMWGGIGLAALVIVGGATALIVQDVRRHRSTKLPPPDARAGQAASGPGVLIMGEDVPPPPPTGDEGTKPA